MILSIFTTNQHQTQTNQIIDKLGLVRNLVIRTVHLESHPDAAHFLSYRNVHPNELPAMFIGLHRIYTTEELLNIKFPDDLPETGQDADNKAARDAEKIMRRELKMAKDIRTA
jgi:hypothetical protein